jgi:hypothetical protein
MSAEIGTVVHATPGRVRLRVAQPYRTTGTYRQIESLLGTLSGIEGVEITPRTGSVLISYDPTTLDDASLLEMATALGWLKAASPEDGPTLGNWLATIDRARLVKGMVLLGAVGLAGLAGPVVGLSARSASLIAGATLVLVGRKVARK